MYGDFFRARKKLRKKHCYTRSRKECPKKQNSWHFERGSLKRQVLEKHGKAAGRSSEEDRTKNLWRIINDAIISARGASSARRYKYSYWTTFQGSILENQQSKSKNALVYPSWIEDTVDALMEANNLITIIRCACQRKRRQQQLDEDNTLIENNTAAEKCEINGSKHDIKPNHCFGTEPNDRSAKLSCQTLEPPSQPNMRSEFEIITPDCCGNTESERELLCNHQTSFNAQFGNTNEVSENAFDGDETDRHFSESQRTESIPYEDNATNHGDSSLLNITSGDIKPCTFKAQILSEGVELQNTFNRNGLCKGQPDFFRETTGVGLDENVDCIMGADAYSNRIIYKTQPTGNSSSTTPVFVCSKALSKKDSLEFGEELSTLGTDFNVNAIYNKSCPVWDAMSGGHVTEDKRPMEMDHPSLKCLEDHVNHRQATTEGLGRLCSNRSPCCRKSWVRVPQLIWSHLNNEYKCMTSAVLGLITIGVFLLIATGNAVSFMGLMLDVIVHAVLLSIVVLVALAVFEANDMTGSLLRDCHSFLQFVRSLVSDRYNVDDEVQPATVSSPVYICNEDTPNRISNSSTPVPDAIDSGLEIHQIPADACFPSESQMMTKGSNDNKREASTTTESVLSSKPARHTPQQSFAETMTDPVNADCTATQTDTICDEEDAVVNYLPLENGEGADAMQESHVTRRSVGSQANIDAKKINEQAQKVQQRHRRNLRRLQRKFLAIRRSFQKDASNLRRCDQRKGDFLAQLQLTIPALHREKTRLTAEKFMVERQYTDQKKKNQDLIGRIAKLNQQFIILGQAQQPVLPFQWRPQFLNQTYGPNQFRGVQAETQQQQQQSKIGISLPNLQPTTQITLPQPQIPPSVPNKWLNNLQQFHQQRQHQVQPQQNKPHQQARLPIFQLLHNSTPSSTNNKEEAKRQQQLQQKQQYQQLQSHNDGGSNPQTKTRSGSSATPFQQGDHPTASQMESVAMAGRIGQTNEDSGK